MHSATPTSLLHLQNLTVLTGPVAFSMQRNVSRHRTGPATPRPWYNYTPELFPPVFGTTRRDVSPEGAVASIRCNGAKRERPLEQRHGAKNPGEIEGMSGNDKHSYLIKHSLVLIHIRLALTKQVFSTQSGN